MVRSAGGNNERDYLNLLLSKLEDDRLKLVDAFVREVIVVNDPDVVETFLSWRRDPRVASLIHLATQIGDDDLEQLLFQAEDYFTQSQLSVNRGTSTD